MPFSFKIDNPAAKFGFYILMPICALLLGYSIISQSCGGATKVPAEKPPVEAVDAPVSP